MLAGCESLSLQKTRTVAIDTSTKVFEPITYSCDDTGRTRAQIVEHNSVYDTIKKGTTVTYRDHCQPVAKATPKAAS